MIYYQIFILLLSLIINLFINNYLFIIFSFILFIFLLINNRKNEFFLKLVSLKKINQFDYSLDKKINIIFPSTNKNDNFESICNNLINKTKDIRFKKFFLQLKECKNKKDVNLLINQYLYFYKSSFNEIFNLIIIFSFFSIILNLKLNYLFKNCNYLIFLNFLYLIILFFLLIDLFSLFFFINKKDQIRYIFYKNLYNKRPLEALSFTLKKYPNSFFKEIYSNIVKEEFIFSNKEINLIDCDIYKLCVNNNSYNLTNLENYLLSKIKYSAHIGNYIILISLIIYFILVVIL